MPKTEVTYFIKMVYVAPENAVDENGKPVFQYQRDILMSKESYDHVVKAMGEGKSKIFIPAVMKFNDEHTEERYIYINLDCGNLMFAETAARETFTEEGVEEIRKSGRAVLYGMDGKPIREVKDREVN